MKRFYQSHFLFLSAILSNGLLVFLGTSWIGQPMGDLNYAYQDWANAGSAFGISVAWVYPYLALVPITLANALTPGALIGGWMAIWLLFNLAVLCVLVFYRVGEDREARYRAGYFWVLSTLCLGPVSISRLDAFSVGFAILGLLFVYLRFSKVASLFLTIALWLKVWPIALISAVFVAVRGKLRSFVTLAAGSLVAIVVAMFLGGNSSVFSFLGDQSSRGIQIESPIAAFWLWPAVVGSQATGIKFNAPLMTFEVFGANTALFANLMTLVQVGALLITSALGLAAFKRGVAPSRIIFWASFTGVLDLIVFNKVGSPQYMTWLVAPVVFGFIAKVAEAKTASALVLVISLITWLIYPIAYDAILASHFWETVLLTLRNLVLLAALVYGNLGLQKLSKKRTNDLVLD